jgi:hypothetical protein
MTPRVAGSWCPFAVGLANDLVTYRPFGKLLVWMRSIGHLYRHAGSQEPELQRAEQAEAEEQEHDAGDEVQ